LMLELTCQGSEVSVVPVNDLRVIRAVDTKAGIVINIPVTATTLAALVDESTEHEAL
jgi:hypothetical protein